MNQAQPRVGTNLTMAAILALLSYVPFEIVAKGSLLFAFGLFVIDPIPPLTRLLALLSVLVVAGLSKLHRQWIAEQKLADEAVTIQDSSTTSPTENDDPTTSSSATDAKKDN